MFDYGNGLRGQAHDAGRRERLRLPRLRPRLHPAAVLPRRRAVPLGLPVRRRPADLAATDDAVLAEFPDDDGLQRWVRFAREKVKGQGLPSRICWLGYGERHRAGLAFDDLVARGTVSAPIAIGRDHLDAGSVASPERETEGMRDGSDAIADWPLLNALVNTASGASWVSIHHGGGVGIGKSIHAGQVVVAEGTRRLPPPGRAGAHQRPGDRRHPPRRRRLRHRARHRARRRRPDAARARHPRAGLAGVTGPTGTCRPPDRPADDLGAAAADRRGGRHHRRRRRLDRPGRGAAGRTRPTAPSSTRPVRPCCRASSTATPTRSGPGSRRDDVAGPARRAAATRPAGIASTVAATRAASYDELLALAAAAVARDASATGPRPSRSSPATA